jgi:transposase
MCGELTYEELSAENSRLKNENIELSKRVDELEILNKHYLEQIRLAAIRRYGSSSEQNIADGQISLCDFNEAETLADCKHPEPTLEEITYKRRKQKGKRDELYKRLQTEQVIYELPENEQVCPQCGGGLHACGHDVARREVVIIPAQIKAVEHVRTVYSCRSCEKKEIQVPMKKSVVPASVIPNSGVASPSLLSYILSNKYGLALPLYRQEQEFRRLGLEISRTTMANWVIYSATTWLKGIYNLLKSEIVKNDILHADESTVQVLREKNRKPTAKSYEWMYHTGRDADKKIALFEYKPTRHAQNAIDFLGDFKGYLHCDGYVGYKKLEEFGVTIVECWSHARRKFTDAVKALLQKDRAASRANIGVKYCDKLFALERKYDKEGLTFDERKKCRERESKPVADKFFDWAESMIPQTLPKSLMGTAVRYAINQKQWLSNFLEDGRLELSNNRAERTLRPFTVGRKNWLFSASVDGATASSIVYSIVETAYANGLVPYLYFMFLFENLPNVPKERYHEFLPWNPAVQKLCAAPNPTYLNRHQ